MTVDWFNQRIDNDFPQSSKIMNLLNSRAFIFAVVIHLILALLMINLVPLGLKTKPAITIQKNKIKAIQSYLYRKPLPSVKQTTSPTKAAEKTPEFKAIKKPLKNKNSKPIKTSKKPKTKNSKSSAATLTSPPQLPTRAKNSSKSSSKNSWSFSALEQLKQLQQQLDQQNINRDANYHNRARGESVFNDLPAAVNHAEKQLTLSEKKEKMTTRYGGSIDIVKNDDGSCILIQDLSNVGMEGIKARSGFKCGQTKMEKAYDAHMDKILKKLGKKN